MAAPTPALIAGAVVCGVALVGAVAWIVYREVTSRRDAGRLLKRVGGALGLTSVPPTATLWAPMRDHLGWAPFPIARGQRRGIPVELCYEPAPCSADRPTTRVVLLWPRPAARATLDRDEMLDGWKSRERKRRRAGFDEAALAAETWLPWEQDPWVGRSALSGEPRDLDRILAPALRVQMKAFPRDLQLVRYFDQLMQIWWVGQEADPAIVAQAFDLGIACLERLASP